MSSEFLGIGWGFPVEPDGEGRVVEAAYEESVRQAIWMILGTSRGERVMRPDFGCGLHDLVYTTNTGASSAAVEFAVREALVLWEPRIDVDDVYARPDPARPNLLLIDINYRVRTTNSRFNLVFPFYQE